MAVGTLAGTIPAQRCSQSMSMQFAFVLAPICLAAIVGGSVWLASELEELDRVYLLLPGLLGLITALGADSPEISSALTAIVGGENEVGAGIVLGSNLFNLAALIGVSALVAGPVATPRRVFAFGGAVSLVETALAACVLLKILTPIVGALAIAIVFAIYAIFLSVRPETAGRLPFPERVANGLVALLKSAHVDVSRRVGRGDDEKEDASAGFSLALRTALALGLVVAGSYGVVHSTLRIGAALDVKKELVGSLVLACLTGIPNLYTALRLALKGKGAAVVSEALNSNTINILVGIALPTLIFGASAKPVAVLEMWWLLGVTGVVLALGLMSSGFTRLGGGAVIAVYFGFVAWRVLV